MAADPSPLDSFFGYVLIAAGVLIALSSGACTLFFLAAYIRPHGDSGMIWVPPLIGSPFILGGIGLIALGRRLSGRRGPRASAEDVF